MDHFRTIITWNNHGKPDCFTGRSDRQNHGPRKEKFETVFKFINYFSSNVHFTFWIFCSIWWKLDGRRTNQEHVLNLKSKVDGLESKRAIEESIEMERDGPWKWTLIYENGRSVGFKSNDLPQSLIELTTQSGTRPSIFRLVVHFLWTWLQILTSWIRDKCISF